MQRLRRYRCWLAVALLAWLLLFHAGLLRPNSTFGPARCSSRCRRWADPGGAAGAADGWRRGPAGACLRNRSGAGLECVTPDRRRSSCITLAAWAAATTSTTSGSSSPAWKTRSPSKASSKAGITQQTGNWQVSLETQLFLNQTFGKNIYVNTPERRVVCGQFRHRSAADLAALPRCAERRLLCGAGPIRHAVWPLLFSELSQQLRRLAVHPLRGDPVSRNGRCWCNGIRASGSSPRRSPTARSSRTPTRRRPSWPASASISPAMRWARA